VSTLEFVQTSESQRQHEHLDILLATGAEIHSPRTFIVNVNGTIVGLTRTPTHFVSNFRKLRRAGRVSEFVSVYINHHYRTVHIASDGGRICRPMIIVENQRSKVTEDHIKVRYSKYLSIVRC
jgi:DNA-directed RNA polymerase III subunit RPC2